MFYDSGAAPRKNLDVMRLAVNELKAEAGVAVEEEPKSAKKDKKKRKSEGVVVAEPAVAMEEVGFVCN